MLFSISTNATITDYHLAVKETAEAVPSAQDMTTGALKRNIGTTAINVLITQKMNAKMIDVAKDFFDNDTETTGTGMFVDFTTNKITAERTVKIAMVFDGADSGGSWTEATRTWVADSVLKPDTAYTLYGMENGGSSVNSILDFQTDQSPASYVDATVGLTGLDSTLTNGHIDITINANEYYIFPVQAKGNMDRSIIARLNFYYTNQELGNLVMLTDRQIFGAADSGYEYQMLLFPFKATFGEEVHNSYVLMDTSRIHRPNNAEKVKFGKFFTATNLATTPQFDYSWLKFQ